MIQIKSIPQKNNNQCIHKHPPCTLMQALDAQEEEELAKQLEATKLYVPGRVLWMTYEEEPLLRRLLVSNEER